MCKKASENLDQEKRRYILLKAALEKTPTKSLTVGNLVENIMKPVVKETLDSYKSLDCSK